MADTPANAADWRIADLSAQLLQERNTRLSLVEPLAKAVMLALDTWCDIAQDPGHPGTKAARNLLRSWSTVMGRVAQVQSGLVVVQTPPPNGST